MKITLKAAFQKDDTMRKGFIAGRYRNISKLTKKTPKAHLIKFNKGSHHDPTNWY